MDDPTRAGTSPNDRFRRTLIQVLIVQVVALAILGVLQALYS